PPRAPAGGPAPPAGEGLQGDPLPPGPGPDLRAARRGGRPARPAPAADDPPPARGAAAPHPLLLSGARSVKRAAADCGPPPRSFRSPAREERRAPGTPRPPGTGEGGGDRPCSGHWRWTGTTTAT